MKTTRIWTLAVLLTGAGIFTFFGLRTEPAGEPVRSNPPKTDGLNTPSVTSVSDKDRHLFSAVPAGILTRQVAPTIETGALPASEQQSLWKAFSEARYAVDTLTGKEKSLPQNQGVKYFANNPDQKIIARFPEDGGLRLCPNRSDLDWELTLAFDTATPPLAVTAHGNLVETSHTDGTTEWFENKPEGIEHGFTVPQPQGNDGILELRLNLDGLKVATDPESPGDLQFVDGTGVPVVGYRALKVWDATGRLLDSAMHPTAEGDGVLLAVNDSRAVYPLKIDPLLVSLTQHLVPTPTEPGNAGGQFGVSVAVDGDTALVGAAHDSNPSGSGVVYVFVRTGLQWQLEATLDPTPHSPWPPPLRFGFAVVIEGDTALIGAPGYEHVPTHRDAGSAVVVPPILTPPGFGYVFVRTGGDWQLQAELPGGSLAGESVALSGDTALVGDLDTDYLESWALVQDTSDPDNPIWDYVLTGWDSVKTSGQVRVFTRSGSQWSLQQVIVGGDDVLPRDLFGCSVALDGDTAVVGAHRAETVHVFTRSGEVWSQQAKLGGRSSPPHGAYRNSGFGTALALEGDTLFVGAPVGLYDFSPGGRVSVFMRNEGTWLLQQTLGSHLYPWAREDGFGTAISIDNDMAVIGAPLHGTAFVYAMTGDSWEKTQVHHIGYGDRFGAAVALDGNTLLVGATNRDAGDIKDVGGVYSFWLAEMPADPSYQEWATASGLVGADAAPESIPFGDGVSNLMKYASNLNGAGPDARQLSNDLLPPFPGVEVITAGLPNVGFFTGEDGSCFLNFHLLLRKKSQLVYTLQISTDLIHWTPVSPPGALNPPIQDEWEDVTFSEPCDPATTPQLYGRIEVSLPAQ